MTKYIRIIVAGLLLSFASVSCTDRFEEMNIDPNRVTLDDPAVAAGAANALFSSAISNGLMRAFEFQRVQALYVDLFSQHYATSAPYFNTDKYQMNQTWLNAGWNLFYPRDISNLATIINSRNTTSNQKLIARTWKVFLFHRMVDTYGDIPYFNASKPNEPEKYDSQQAIYGDFFKELKAAADSLDLTVTNSFDNKDVIYGGNTARWKAFANALRMRLAMRISKADPTRARTEFLAAVASGTFASNDNNALAKVSDFQRNALNEITGFNEFRMSATSESLLVGYNDPRLPEYFSPAVGGTGANAPYTGVYNGLRNGLTATELALPENTNANNSNVGMRFSRTAMATNSRIVLTYAETCFLLAEASLNGWAVTGTAKEWYEKGITASMQQFGVTDNARITAYVAGTALPKVPAGLARPIAALPVVFSGTEAEQREQIGIQKWLAVYPDGFEGWSEFRRTGFPKLYAPANYDPSSDVKPGEFIQRIPYTDQMRSFNTTGLAAAETRMGGSGQSVKLWWAGGK